MTEPELFIDENIRLNEKAKPWSLSEYQRLVLSLMFAKYYSTRIWSEIKKSGKTFIAACLLLWWAFKTPYAEIIVAANDEEQSIGRVFKTAAALIRNNPSLAGSAQVLSNEIRLSNGTVITAIASDYKGAAGGRQSLVVYDELWGYSTENLRRLFEELTVVPTETEPWTLITTYAGFVGESDLLENLYRRGLKGKRLNRRLPIYASNGLFMFWSTEPRQPWQLGAEGRKYYAEQRLILRPNTYKRLHENQWVSAESAFITAEQWDAIVDDTLSPLLPTKEHSLTLGVDIGTKNDNAAVVGVRRDESGKVVVCFHRVWRPKFLQPVQLADIEEFIKETCKSYRVHAIAFDPSQAYSMIQSLQRSGLPALEFPQTTTNTTAMATELFNLVTGKNIRSYADKTLREHVINAVGVESGNHVRMAKPSGSRKIDIAAALAIGCVTLLRGPQPIDISMMGAFGNRVARADRDWVSQPGFTQGSGDDRVPGVGTTTIRIGGGRTFFDW